METLTTAIAWKADRYIYCMSHKSNQVIGEIEMLTKDSEYLYEGIRCSWCGKKLK